MLSETKSFFMRGWPHGLEKACDSESQEVRGLFEFHMEKGPDLCGHHPLSTLPYQPHVNLTHELSLICLRAFALTPSSWKVLPPHTHLGHSCSIFSQISPSLEAFLRAQL